MHPAQAFTLCWYHQSLYRSKKSLTNNAAGNDMKDARDHHTVRVLFALWPSSEIRESIVARREQLGRMSPRMVPAYNLHLTLLFLGNQQRAMLDELIAAASSINLPGFSLSLDRFGWFPRARVAWLGGEMVEAGRILVQALESTCSDLGMHFDERPWKPHVTLYRQVRKPPQWPPIQPLEWHVQEYVLVESIGGKPYNVMHRWKLGAS